MGYYLLLYYGDKYDESLTDSDKTFDVDGSQVTGYRMIEADSKEAAVRLSKDISATSGRAEIYPS